MRVIIDIHIFYSFIIHIVSNFASFFLNLNNNLQSYSLIWAWFVIFYYKKKEGCPSSLWAIRDCLARSRITAIPCFASWILSNRKSTSASAHSRSKRFTCSRHVKKRGLPLFSLGDTWLEHVTPTMSMWCATNCANRPYVVLILLQNLFIQF